MQTRQDWLLQSWGPVLPQVQSRHIYSTRVLRPSGVLQGNKWEACVHVSWHVTQRTRWARLQEEIEPTPYTHQELAIDC